MKQGRPDDWCRKAASRSLYENRTNGSDERLGKPDLCRHLKVNHRHPAYKKVCIRKTQDPRRSSSGGCQGWSRCMSETEPAARQANPIAPGERMLLTRLRHCEGACLSQVCPGHGKETTWCLSMGQRVGCALVFWRERCIACRARRGERLSTFSLWLPAVDLGVRRAGNSTREWCVSGWRKVCKVSPTSVHARGFCRRFYHTARAAGAVYTT